MNPSISPFVTLRNFTTFAKYSDFTIAAGPYTFRVHRAVICSQSGYFETLCESEFKEAQERKVELKEDDPEAVRCVIEFLYTRDYRVHGLMGADEQNATPWTSSVDPDNEHDGFEQVTDGTDDALYPFELHIKVFCLADKYVIPQLQDLVCAKVREIDERNLSRDITTPLLDKRLSELATTIYSMTEDDKEAQAQAIDVDKVARHGIRDKIVKIVAQRAAYTLRRSRKQDFVPLLQFREVFGDFVSDLLEEAAESSRFQIGGGNPAKQGRISESSSTTLNAQDDSELMEYFDTLY